MKTVGLIPSQTLVSLQQDEQGNWLNVPEGQTVVPLVKTAAPSFDDATQRLVAAEPEWFADRVERRFSVVPLSVEELAEIQQSNRRAQAKEMVIKLENGTATTAEMRNALAAVIRHLFR